jgi:sugar phosphate isomerase/epimerase
MNVLANLDAVFGDIAAAGFTWVELPQACLDCEQNREPTRALLAQQGLRPISVFLEQRPLFEPRAGAQMLEDAHLVAPILAELGGRYLVVSGPGKPDGVWDADERATQVATLAELGRVAQAHGLSLTYHLYAPHVQHDEAAVRLIREAPADLVSLGPDLDWVWQGGVDPEDFLRRHADRVNYLHLRDSRDRRWTEALGEGDVDYASLGRTLEEIGFAGAVVIELAFPPGFVATRPLRDSLRLSREHVRATMGL